MAGIFIAAGASPANTTNAVNVPTTPSCPATFYRNGCTPRFDAMATNAIMSELLNAMTMLGDPYDCERLDNLKGLLTKARNLCNLPATNADMDDFIAGCFDGVSGLAPIQQIQQLFGICNLPAATAPDMDDAIGMCVDGVNVQVPVNNFVDLVKTQIPPPPSGFSGFRLGGVIWDEVWSPGISGTRHADLSGHESFFVHLIPVLGGNPSSAFNIKEHPVNAANNYCLVTRMTDGNRWMQYGNSMQFLNQGSGDDYAVYPVDSNDDGRIRFIDAIKIQGA